VLLVEAEMVIFYSSLIISNPDQAILPMFLITLLEVLQDNKMELLMKMEY